MCTRSGRRAKRERGGNSGESEWVHRGRDAGDIFCYSLGPGDLEPGLSASTVERAKALSLSIEIDHYGNADTDDEAG